MAHKRVDKASDETINKTFAEYKQRELDEKGPKLEKPQENIYQSLLYWNSQVVENKGVKISQQNIENDPIIKNHMVILDFFQRVLQVIFLPLFLLL